MTVLEILLVGVGGFIGAIFRYLLSSKFNNRVRLPVGTLLVNLLGSLLIGVVIGLALPSVWTFFLVSGLLGALTTFSTLQKEVIEQWQKQDRKTAVSYTLITYGFGIIFAFMGYFVAK